MKSCGRHACPRVRGIMEPVQDQLLPVKSWRHPAMANLREPLLMPVPILSLRPTQMTVGMREVKEKRKRWREHRSDKKRAKLLGTNMIPVVLGPDQRHYVVDHHHLARALHDEDVKDVLVTVIA